DSPWMVLPEPILFAGGGWGFSAYFNNINFLSMPPASGATISGNGQHFGPEDILSDPRAPMNDAQADQSAFRLVWYGFYRQKANLGVEYAAAVCRQKRTDTFAPQDLSALTPLDANGRVTAFVSPVIDPAYNFPAPNAFISRLPMPWRITVYYNAVAGSHRLSN